MKKEFHLTKAGIAELENERADLIANRSVIAEKLKVAREHGDLSENAEYHNAREEQGQLEQRINDIEHILRNVNIIENSTGNTDVGLANTVELKGDKGVVTYTIVGSVEADPLANKISDESPIGQALLGKKVGDEVIIVLPAGKTIYKVQSIK